jgi:hypothetical protein
MSDWYVYRLSDGRFTGEIQRAKKIEQLALPPGCGRRQGVSDWRMQRIDPANGNLVACEVEAVATDATARRVNAISQLRYLEQTKQPRILREYIDNPTARGEDGKTPRERLSELMAETERLRGELKGS